MKVKDLVVSKIELAYDLCEKYQSENPFNNGVLNEDLKSFFSKEFFEDVIDECDNEDEKKEEIIESLSQFYHENLSIENEVLFNLYDAFRDENETEYNLNDIKVARDEYESCEDKDEFETMMEHVLQFKLMSIKANLVDSRF